MIGALGTLTPADVNAWCAANGTAPADCAAMIASQSVGGVFCDGDVAISIDAAGNHVSSCIPTGALEAKFAAMKADCLAHCGDTTRTAAAAEQCVPWCGGGTPPPSSSCAGLVLGALALAALGYVALRHL